MEWVETAGRSVDEAVRAAAAHLGVAIGEVEVQIVTQRPGGLLSRFRKEARVRARVRPRKPPAKDEHRRRRRRHAGSDSGGEDQVPAQGADRGADVPAESPGQRRQRHRGRAGKPSQGSAGKASQGSPQVPDGSSRLAGDDLARAPRAASVRVARQGGAARRADGPDQGPAGPDELLVDIEEGAVMAEIGLQEQAELAREFLVELLQRFELDGEVGIVGVDEEGIELAIDGVDLSLLVGSRGATLDALQDLTRTVVQRRTASAGRLFLDVAGYRQRRKEALDRFARGVADEVLAIGEERALEPMSAADRKVVHNSIAAVSGVGSRSEGEDPHRQVVIFPMPDGALAPAGPAGSQDAGSPPSEG